MFFFFLRQFILYIAKTVINVMVNTKILNFYKIIIKLINVMHYIYLGINNIYFCFENKFNVYYHVIILITVIQKANYR